MLETLLYAGFLVSLGMLGTRPSALVLGLIGVPALWVSRRFPRQIVVARISTWAAVFAELYVVLAFAASLMTWTKWLLAKRPDLYASPLLMACLFAAVLPPTLIWLTTIPTPDEEGEHFPVSLSTIGGTVRLAPVGIIGLAFLSPGMLVRVWPWAGLGSPSQSIEAVLLISGLVWATHLSRRFWQEFPLLKRALSRFHRLTLPVDDRCRP